MRVIEALPPSASLRLQCIKKLGYIPNFKRPRRFNEHIQARKLYDRNPLFVQLADKVAVKQFVTERVGADYVTPTLWSGTRLPEQVEWPFPIMVKTNFGSTMNAIVRSKDEWPAVREQAHNWLERDWPRYLHEWWYDEIERQILVEPLIADEPVDFKFLCFGGRVQIISLDFDRQVKHTKLFYSRDWQLQPFTVDYPRRREPCPRPKHLPKMIKLAETLASGFSFVRVDIYDLESGPRFGEMTFSPGAGLSRFDPPEYDRVLGAMWPA